MILVSFSPVSAGQIDLDRLKKIINFMIILMIQFISEDMSPTSLTNKTLFKKRNVLILSWQLHLNTINILDINFPG